MGFSVKSISVEGSTKVEKVDNIVLLAPEEIDADPTRNGRSEPHTQEDIDARVKSFEEVGQLEPVVVRLVGKKAHLVLGFLRHAAALKFNELHPDRPMRLSCTVRQCDELEAFRLNIIENKERREVSPIDDAVNQRRLREVWGWKDKAIAEFYGQQQSEVSSLKKLLSLSPDLKQLVHRRLMTVQVAKYISGLPEKEQKALIASAQDETGKVNSSVVLDTLRSKTEEQEPASAGGVENSDSSSTTPEPSTNGHQEQGGDKPEKGTAPGKPPIVPRNLSKVRQYFEKHRLAADNSPELIAFCEAFDKFCAGKMSDKTFDKKLWEWFPSVEEAEAK